MTGNTFFYYKQDLERFSLEIHSLTVRFEKKIFQNFSSDMIECVGLIYENMRFQADCEVGKYAVSEIESKKEYGAGKIRRQLGYSAEQRISYSVLEDELKQKGNTLLMVLKDYKAAISGLYRKCVPFLWHVSPVPDLKLLRPSLHKENMYYNEVCDVVFATSDYEEILLYLGRVLGKEMTVMDRICLYKQKPYQSWNDREIRLGDSAFIYYLKIENFEPVIDFVNDNGRVYLKFGNEWICRSKVPVYKSEQVLFIPVESMRKYHVYYGLRNISLSPYVDKLGKKDSIESREIYLQKLMDDKIIAPVNFS